MATLKGNLLNSKFYSKLCMDKWIYVSVKHSAQVS